MGWKSTQEVPRQRAIGVIQEWLEKVSNETLGDMLEQLNDDEATGHPMGYGHNFTICEPEPCCPNCGTPASQHLPPLPGTHGRRCPKCCDI